jgi:cell division protease FtsH
MIPGLGQVAYEEPRQGFLGDMPNPFGAQREYSEETAREIDCAVRELTETAYARAQDILSRNREALDRGAEMLLERETIDAEDLKALEPLLDRREPAPTGSVGRIATDMPAAPRGDGADERRRAAGR